MLIYIKRIYTTLQTYFRESTFGLGSQRESWDSAHFIRRIKFDVPVWEPFLKEKSLSQAESVASTRWGIPKGRHHGREGENLTIRPRVLPPRLAGKFRGPTPYWSMVHTCCAKRCKINKCLGVPKCNIVASLVASIHISSVPAELPNPGGRYGKKHARMRWPRWHTKNAVNYPSVNFSATPGLPLQGHKPCRLFFNLASGQANAEPFPSERH